MGDREIRHAVFGAGLVGGYLGAALMANSALVRWVARPHVQKKLSDGIRITDYLANQYDLPSPEFVELDEMANPEEPPDVLWLTVKCNSLQAVVRQIKPMLDSETVIISLQNGLGSEDILKEHFPENRIVRGVMGANVVELEPGHLHRGTEGCVELYECAETKALLPQFQLDILPLKLHSNIEGLVWSKLQLNLNNAINALSDIPLKQELSDRGYREVLALAQKELLAVADLKKIQLQKITPVSPTLLPAVLRLPNWIYLRIASKMLAIDPEARSSMWCDLSDGKPTEIEFLNGAVVEEGKKLGLDCPVNAKLVSLIRAIENRELDRGLSSFELMP